MRKGNIRVHIDPEAARIAKRDYGIDVYAEAKAAVRQIEATERLRQQGRLKPFPPELVAKGRQLVEDEDAAREAVGERFHEMFDEHTVKDEKDPDEWFHNEEHAHIVGMDNALQKDLRVHLQCEHIEVDCGVEGERSYTYHFRIRAPQDLHSHCVSRAIDLLSSWTPYRFEIRCVTT